MGAAGKAAASCLHTVCRLLPHSAA